MNRAMKKSAMKESRKKAWTRSAAFGLAGLSMMAVPALAQDRMAPQTGLYLAAGAGLNQPSDADSRVRPSPFVTDVVEFGTGYNLVGAVGYKWTSGLRTELEFDYRRA